MLSPLVVGYLFLRAFRSKAWWDTVPERLGRLPFRVTAPDGIWLHAVSVGEVLSAVALLRTLRQELPDTPIYVSTTTLAGRAMAEQRLGERPDGQRLADGIFYAPIDYVFAVRRVLRRLQPGLVIILETEIWPNLWREAKRSGARLLVANGRISDKALPSYLRWRRLFGPVLRQADLILTQSEQDAARYSAVAGAVGRAPANGQPNAPWIENAGNLKFDLDPSRTPIAADLEAWRQQWPANTWVVMAASSMPGVDAEDVDEDLALLDVFQQVATQARQQGRSLLWVQVPRKPERFDWVAAQLAERQLPFVRRSQLPAAAAATNSGPFAAAWPQPGGMVLLVDSMGELGGLLAWADLVVMGGTFARRGGHNLLEPAFHRKAILTGPHNQNFAEIAAALLAAGGMRQVDRIGALPEAIVSLWNNPEQAEALAAAAHRVATSKGGAVGRIAARARQELDESLRKPLRTWLERVTLTPLAWVWGAVARRQRRRSRVDLGRPVLCVGGITVGGAGKTPMVLEAARRLPKAAILTRGYRRQSANPVTLVRRGESAPVQETGDEAQIFVRAQVADVGISANRVAAGRQLLAQGPVGCFVMDDGFQHHRLQRTVDLVLIDAMNPFGGEAVLPLGRLREPLDGLQRASLLLLTRTQRGRQYTALRRRLALLAPQAPVYTSRFVEKAWVEAFSGKRVANAELASQRVGAFCGLGNPGSFWTSLRRLGIAPAWRWRFGDHHHYRPAEIRRLGFAAREQGLTALLTTEKDLMNLPPETEHLLKGIPLYWLQVEMAIEQDRRFWEELEKRLI